MARAGRGRRLRASRPAPLRRGRALREAHRSPQAERLMGELEFREATLDDASFSADVHTQVFPERPTDPVVERYWWAQPDDTFVIRRWVVRRDSADIGVAYFEHPAWERLDVPHGDIGGEILPLHRQRTTLSDMLAEMERRLGRGGAKGVRG